MATLSKRDLDRINRYGKFYPLQCSEYEMREGVVCMVNVKKIVNYTKEDAIKKVELVFNSLSPDDQLKSSCFFQSIIKKLKT